MLTWMKDHKSCRWKGPELVDHCIMEISLKGPSRTFSNDRRRPPPASCNYGMPLLCDYVNISKTYTNFTSQFTKFANRH